MVLVKYDKDTLEVEGLFKEEQKDIIGDTFLEITEEEETKLLSLNRKGTLFLKNKDSKEFEARQVDLPVIIGTQDKINADLIKQNAELKSEIEVQKNINSQMLLEIAKLKGGN